MLSPHRLWIKVQATIDALHEWELSIDSRLTGAFVVLKVRKRAGFCCKSYESLLIWKFTAYTRAEAHVNRMLFIGRVLLGIAVAMASVAVTLYNSEMAPAQHRGRLNQIFQV